VTGAEFSGVDIDLLADYVGGALDGTPDEAVVAALVADDAAWRDAYDLLSGGVGLVGEGLRALGADAGPMPDDVVARLTAALAELPLTSPDDAGDSEVATAGRHLSVVPDASGTSGAKRAGGSRAGRQRRLRKWAAPIAAAAGVVAFAGAGLGYVLNGGQNGSARSDTSAAQSAPQLNEPLVGSGDPKKRSRAEGDGSAAGAAPAADQITQSGADYRRDTLANDNAMKAADAGSAAPAPTSGPVPPSAETPASGRVPFAGKTDPTLARLNDRAALATCLNAIAAEHGAGPMTVQNVDFARFEGSPALVVRFGAGDGNWAWASGPDCGQPGFGAATRYQVRVG
jgi:hypothetical protein